MTSLFEVYASVIMVCVLLGAALGAIGGILTVVLGIIEAHAYAIYGIYTGCKKLYAAIKKTGG